MYLKRQNQSDYLEEQNHYSAELDTGDHLISLVPFSGTKQLESQQNWPIYNSLYTDEITCSVDHQIPPLFFLSSPTVENELEGLASRKKILCHQSPGVMGSHTTFEEPLKLLCYMRSAILESSHQIFADRA